MIGRDQGLDSSGNMETRKTCRAGKPPNHLTYVALACGPDDVDSPKIYTAVGPLLPHIAPANRCHFGRNIAFTVRLVPG